MLLGGKMYVKSSIYEPLIFIIINREMVRDKLLSIPTGFFLIDEIRM